MERRSAERGAYDFETYEWVQPLACGLLWGPKGAREWLFIHDGRNHEPKCARMVADDTLKQMALIAQDGGPKEWWAHNGGKFDSSLILESVVQLGWKASGAVAGGRVVSLKVEPPGGPKFELRDSMAVVSASLKRAAEDFQLEARKEFGAEDYKGDMRNLPLKKLESGCLADCEVVLQLLDAVESMAEGWGGQLRMTAASTAFSIVKARVQLPDLRPWHGANEVARQAYMGGRVEVFHHSPMGVLCELDVTSSYPWSMAGDLPFTPLGPASRLVLSDMMKDAGTTDGVVRAEVTVPEDEEFPALPWAHPDGGIFFPTGTWQAWFQAVELRYAQTLGYKIRTLEGWAYNREAPFKAFVEEVFSHKASAKGALRAFDKLLLNSSYGKLGQHPERENLLCFPTEEEGADYIEEAPEDSVRVMDESGSLKFLARAVFRWPSHTHYAAAGCVTAKSRILIHQGITRAVAPAYTDTDSIHCAVSSARKFKTGEALGQLKVEVPRMMGKYYAPKLYELHPEKGKAVYASKGFPVDAATFRKVVAGEVVMKERPRLMRRQFHHGGAAAVEEMRRSWSGRSMKRRPLENGSTVPWTVCELEEGAHLNARSPLALKQIC